MPHLTMTCVCCSLSERNQHIDSKIKGYTYVRFMVLIDSANCVSFCCCGHILASLHVVRDQMKSSIIIVIPGIRGILSRNSFHSLCKLLSPPRPAPLIRPARPPRAQHDQPTHDGAHRNRPQSPLILFLCYRFGGRNSARWRSQEQERPPKRHKVAPRPAHLLRPQRQRTTRRRQPLRKGLV